MMRCSQPLTGTSGKRCKEDEKLVNAVLGIGKRGYIVDTRSLSIAKAAQKEGNYSVNTFCTKVTVSNDQEMAHLERNFHSRNQSGKKLS